MKAVLMAFSSEECELILSGEKIIDVRKTAPKLKPPFKVYMYESLGRKIPCRKCAIWQDCPMRSPFGCNEGAGAVVGEFVCDRVEKYEHFIPYDIDDELQYSISEDSLISTCLEPYELTEYGRGKTLRGLHIAAPKRYDTPKELSELVSCKYYHDKECLLSSKTHCKYRVPDLNPDGSVNIFECTKRVTRPPQSWMYVEEIEE